MRAFLVAGVCLIAFVQSCAASSGDDTASNAGAAGNKDAGSSDASDAQSCTPRSCAQLGASCGDVLDPCGVVVSCGPCPSGQTCGAQIANQCGSGSCVPKPARSSARRAG